jgi:hypothetical protein
VRNAGGFGGVLHRRLPPVVLLCQRCGWAVASHFRSGLHLPGLHRRLAYPLSTLVNRPFEAAVLPTQTKNIMTQSVLGFGAVAYFPRHSCIWNYGQQLSLSRYLKRWTIQAHHLMGLLMHSDVLGKDKRQPTPCGGHLSLVVN